MAGDIHEPTSRVSPLRPSRQSIIASPVELIDIERKTTSNLSQLHEKYNQGSGSVYLYTTLSRLDKIYNFSRLDFGIGMRPDFPGFIILFYGLSSPPEILLVQVAQNLHPALRVDVFLSRGITCRTGQTGVGKCAGLHLHCAMGI